MTKVEIRTRTFLAIIVAILLVYLFYQGLAIPAAFVLVVWAYVIAPLVADRLGVEAGTMFVGKRRHTEQPLASRAQALMKQCNYSDAFKEYNELAEKFPTSIELYQPLFELAFTKLNDPESARDIYKVGWNAMEGDQRKKLERLFNEFKTDSPID